MARTMNWGDLIAELGLRQENESLKAENKRLKKEIESLTRMITKLEGKVKK